MEKLDHYSLCLDFAIHWGRARFLKGYVVDLPTIEIAWDKFVGRNINVEVNLLKGFNLFTKELNKSLEFLGSEATLGLKPADNHFFINYYNYSFDEEDDVRFKIIDSLAILDSIVFISTATNAFYPVNRYENFKLKVNQCFEQLFLGKKLFFLLRFIPINQFRRQRLQLIPRQHHYLFPWYSYFSEYSQRSLIKLANLKEKNSSEKNKLFFLEKDLSQDPELNQFLN